MALAGVNLPNLSLPSIDMGTAAAVVNPVGLVGNIVGSGINALSQGKANQANEDIANNQMNFQREMSNTAHVREVKDLMAAGLNPILSSHGGGASTPGGAGATMQAPQISMPDFMAYGISLKQLEQADQRLEIDRANSAANIARSVSDTELNQMRKFLMNRGVPAAQLGAQAADLVHQYIKHMRSSINDVSRGTSQKNMGATVRGKKVENMDNDFDLMRRGFRFGKD